MGSLLLLPELGLGGSLSPHSTQQTQELVFVGGPFHFGDVLVFSTGFREL